MGFVGVGVIQARIVWGGVGVVRVGVVRSRKQIALQTEGGVHKIQNVVGLETSMQHGFNSPKLF